MVTIDRIDAAILDIPTIRGHVLAMATMRQQSFVLVHVRFSDGSTGLGEGASIGGLSYGNESPESILSAVRDFIAPCLNGLPADNVNGAILRMEKAVKGNFIARAAVEMALWDGLARRRGLPLADLFGGAVRTSMPVAWTLASGVSSTDIEEAKELIAAARHNIFKLKIGTRNVRDDIAHVTAIRQALGDGVGIRVDVNQAWSMHDARWGTAGLEELGAELVEQPLSASDTAGMAELTASSRIAIMADEALNGPVDAQALACRRAADVFAVKVAQSGGLKRAREVCAIADAAGIGTYAGTMLESGVGTAASLHLFATVDKLQWGSELFAPLLFADEILAEPIRYSDFAVHVPDGPGIGVELDPDKLAHYRRDSRKSSLHALTN